MSENVQNRFLNGSSVNVERCTDVQVVTHVSPICTCFALMSPNCLDCSVGTSLYDLLTSQRLKLLCTQKICISHLYNGGDCFALSRCRRPCDLQRTICTKNKSTLLYNTSECFPHPLHGKLLLSRTCPKKVLFRSESVTIIFID